MENNELSLSQIVSPYLSTISSSNPELSLPDFKKAVDKIEPIISSMMERNMDALFGLLYKLDISEEKVKHILFGDHNEKASLLLSEAIVKREIVRRIFRLKYSS